MAVDALARAIAAGKTPVTAYEEAVKAGYTGTEEQFAQDMGNSGTNAANAAASASAAAASAESVSASAAQIATNTSDISDLKESIDALTGTSDNITETTTINGTNVAGATATYTGGKIAIYGTSTGARGYLCLNGQNAVKISTGTFAQTIPAGTYKASITVEGNVPEQYLRATPNTYSGDAFNIYDGDVFTTAVPLMVGLWVQYNLNYGTSDNPTYFDIYLTPISEKQNKLTFDNAPTAESMNPVTSGGIYTQLVKYLALSATDAITIPDNSDIHDYKTPGTYKITNSKHAETMTNLPASIPGKLIVLETTQATRVVHLYFGNSTSVPVPVYCEYFNGTDWSTWDAFSKYSHFTELRERIEYLNRKVKILYESGSYASDKATERISIYVPVTEGYILYRLYHFVDIDINSNCWQIYHIYHVDDSLNNQVDLTVTGEYECAIHLEDRDDFSGGHTHGDEVMTNSYALIDGQYTNISAITTLTEVDNFVFVRNSYLYDPNDHSTIIAEHGVEYAVNKNGLIMSQSLEWKINAALTNCFMTMFLPSKAHIDRAFTNSDFKVINLPSDVSTALTTVIKNKANAISMYDTDRGLFANVECPVYPTGLTGGDAVSISDNGGLNYNKVYFKVCGGGTSAVGELWQSKTLFKLDYKS